MSNDTRWTLQVPVQLRRQIEPLAHRNGLDAASYARHLLHVAVQSAAAADYRQRAQQGELMRRDAGGVGDGSNR
jgi:hypothetical protein